MINNLRLFAVVFVPLTTSISASYESLVIGRMALMLNFFIIIVISRWQWNYAIKSKHSLGSEKLTKRSIKLFDERNREILITSGIVTITSVFIGNLAALLFALQPLLEKYRNRKITIED